MDIWQHPLIQRGKQALPQHWRSKVGCALVPWIAALHKGVDVARHRIVSPVGHISAPIMQMISQRITRRWEPYSRLFFVGEPASWVLSWEIQEVQTIAHSLQVLTPNPRWMASAEQQAVFYASQFSLLRDDWLTSSHRVAFTYFHGRPDTPGTQDFARCYARISQYHARISRIQVSHREMYDLMLSTGLDAAKVFWIPIGVNLSYFSPQSPESRQQIRAEYGLPETAFIVGSFQKDGIGWGDGLEPKLIKGPDILLKTLKILKSRIPELFVLLTGPARGYVKAGLERSGIPYHHVYLRYYPELGRLFHALDAYVITSRQEGGPKAAFESMASGVPLITTRVGQAMDVVRHGHNGWMVDVEDAEGLAYWIEYVRSHGGELLPVVRNARHVAEANSYSAQTPLWRDFLEGFVTI